MTGSTQMNDFAQALIDYAEGREPKKYPGTFTKRISDEIAAQVPTSWGIEAWKVYARAYETLYLEVPNSIRKQWKAGMKFRFVQILDSEE